MTHSHAKVSIKKINTQKGRLSCTWKDFFFYNLHQKNLKFKMIISKQR